MTRRSEVIRRNYHLRLRAIKAETQRRLAAAYDRVSESDIRATYAAFVPIAARTITAGQAASQTTTRAYVRGVTGRDPLPLPALAGTSKAGTITEALAGIDLFVLGWIGKGSPASEALTAGAGLVDRLADAEVTRVVDDEILGQSVQAMASRATAEGQSPAKAIGWRGYTFGATDECMDNEGEHDLGEEMFRHPNCVVGSTVVDALPQTFLPVNPSQSDGPRPIRIAMRRWYSGEVVSIRTAAGNLLTVTPNHPILTDRGWVPAGLLDEGSHVIRSLWAQRPLAGISPDEYDVPARIEDVFRARSVAGLLTVPTSTEDFHGDGLDGQVSVVAPYRFLWRRSEASRGQPAVEGSLSLGAIDLPGLDGVRPLPFLGVGHDATPDRRVGSGRIRGSLRGGEASVSEDLRLAYSAHGDRMIQENAADGGSLVVTLERDRELGHARDIVPTDRVSDGGRHGDQGVRFDPSGSHMTAEGQASYSERGRDLRRRLSGLVTLDRIVHYRRSEWSGHVYNLETREGWFNANGVIVSNCVCERDLIFEDVVP